jgi:hypothetical protein
MVIDPVLVIGPMNNRVIAFPYIAPLMQSKVDHLREMGFRFPQLFPCRIIEIMPIRIKR